MKRPLPAARSIVVTCLVALVSVIAIPAGAQTAQTAKTAAAQQARDACPAGGVPATAFSDTVRSPHRAAIDCAAWWGITSGRTATSFGPADEIRRGQAAAMIARLLNAAGADVEEVAPAGFADTAGHTFEHDIDALASLGIVTGVTETRFAPDQPIDRAQMASIIARMFDLGIGSPLPPGLTSFDDVPANNVHAAAISSLADAGITAGTTATRYEPRSPVVRGQMATFLMRATSRLVGQGEVSLPEATPAADDPYNSRTRGAWVHLFDGSLKNRTSIDALVNELALADANTIIAQVARRHDAYYDSDVLPRTPDPSVATDFDVLAELLDAAHARGMEVHAWISVAPTYHGVYDDLPNPPGWVASTHGSGDDIPDDQRWVTKTRDGDWSTYLDPGVPAVQDHVAAIVGELAERYDVDGIHLDYVRYQSNRHGYHPIAVERFQEREARTDVPEPTDPRWAWWRRQQTREVMRRAGEAIAASGNEVELSAAVITWGDGPESLDQAAFRGTMPFWRTLQDWDGWLRDGLVDTVFPMNYYRDHDTTQRRQFARWLQYEQYLRGEVEGRIVPGPAGYLNHPTAAYDQAQTAMRMGDGAMIYSFQQPTEDGSRDIWRQLGETRWGYAPVR